MPAPAALNEGLITGQAMGAGVTYDMIGQNGGTDPRIWVGGESELTVLVEMTGAAVGDLIVTVQPYSMDHATLIPMALPTLATQTPVTNPAFGSGKCTFAGVFDVSGYDMVKVSIKNNNAGAQTINRASWSLGSGG